MAEEQKNYNEKVPANTWPYIVAILIGAIVYLFLSRDSINDKYVQEVKENGNLKAANSKIIEDYANRLERIHEQRRELVTYTSRLRVDTSLRFNSPAPDKNGSANQP